MSLKIRQRSNEIFIKKVCDELNGCHGKKDICFVCCILIKTQTNHDNFYLNVNLFVKNCSQSVYCCSNAMGSMNHSDNKATEKNISGLY